ncbi:hypothetical protein [Nocardiopsis synnemataformans]|uniref:hypothetical protein n=1 Tax=Nocardiopsis synnemataformans TaxID=61305 RepID=UPI003EB7CE4A
MEEAKETEQMEEKGFVENERLKGRNSEIWKHHLAGWTQERIAEKFEVSQPTVSRAIRAIRASIPEATREALIVTEIERLDHTLVKCWEVLERPHMVVSQSGRIVHEIVEYALDDEGNIRIDDHGNPIPKKLRKVMDDGPTLQAADRVMAISRERRKLLGLDAPTNAKVQHEGGIRYEVVGVDPEALK